MGYEDTVVRTTLDLEGLFSTVIQTDVRTILYLEGLLETLMITVVTTTKFLHAPFRPSSGIKVGDMDIMLWN